MNKVVETITNRLIERSESSRSQFLANCQEQAATGKSRTNISCGNLAHAVAASDPNEKLKILNFTHANVALVTSYNDMVSAHQPYHAYPAAIKKHLHTFGHTAQVAGGVPAMCDGVTQGQDGMDMSLFSRDLIAQSTALSLSHNVYDATLLLGVCDKIAPGMLMGALAYAHLPTAFVPTGLMPTGISNDEKVAVRQQFIANQVDEQALQRMECQAYHSAGTCTFYGTANTNQLIFETMGLMLPGSAFVPPDSLLRTKLTEEVATRISAATQTSPGYRPLFEVVTEKCIINGVIALLASGGSTNHTIHLLAIARAAGIQLSWQDISELSSEVPLLVNVYPNGAADMNAFQEAGGVPALLKRLDADDLLHRDVVSTFGDFSRQLTTPYLDDDQLKWRETEGSTNPDVIAPIGQSFQTSGGIQMLAGNIGRSVIKVSAIAPERRYIKAPAKVFRCQHAVEQAYLDGELNQDCVVVVSHNGPSANGMPELHKLMPILANLQKKGLKTALVTDGRLSGASGKVPSAIHMSPEASRGGSIGLIQDGDVICLDCESGTINNLSDTQGREPINLDTEASQATWGRALFKTARQSVTSAEQGASFIL
ncbi:phosphogluconate dehydratase [Neiella marina]|uniref:Phosphogluconate dehydratase n=1 Tax=Neiella holothuriorum TaxID=2870530 RepID=A0ABS7EI43_9GAMM|nr:phosphogluconate dehydratase [Neiella holothuriorum]MBW8191909.1 phosphogluconate dehydratase [Neiella holothuriorum]